MAISRHPAPGTILICDFDRGFVEPEMVKPRPVVVISPAIGARPNLCTVVALSSTPPNPVLPFHCTIMPNPPLPPPWDQAVRTWVKGDMIYAVSFARLDFIKLGKDVRGKRIYRYDVLDAAQMKDIKACVLRGLGMAQLAQYLP
jgi:mRNA interferase MazF